MTTFLNPTTELARKAGISWGSVFNTNDTGETLIPFVFVYATKDLESDWIQQGTDETSMP